MIIKINWEWAIIGVMAFTMVSVFVFYKQMSKPLEKIMSDQEMQEDVCEAMVDRPCTKFMDTKEGKEYVRTHPFSWL